MPQLQRKIAAARELRQRTRVLDSSDVLFSSEQQSFDGFVDKNEEEDFMRRLGANSKRVDATELQGEQQTQGPERRVSQMLSYDAKKRQTEDR